MLWLLGLLFALGLAIGAYAIFAPARETARTEPEPAAADRPAPPLDDSWTRDAGDEFSRLSESARCDLIFAVEVLDDERSHRLLLHALADPSEPVALAAARTLAKRGYVDDVRRMVQTARGARGNEFMDVLSLLG